MTYPHNCATLDLTNDAEVKEKGLERIWFEFENLKEASNVTVEIRLQGLNLAGTAEGLYSSAEAIRLPTKTHRKYAVQVSQRVFMESDKVQKCRNYPQSGFSSYQACEDEYVRKVLNDLAPGLVPIWLADDRKQVTTHMIKPQKLTGIHPMYIHYILT